MAKCRDYKILARERPAKIVLPKSTHIHNFHLQIPLTGQPQSEKPPLRPFNLKFQTFPPSSLYLLSKHPTPLSSAWPPPPHTWFPLEHVAEHQRYFWVNSLLAHENHIFRLHSN